MSAPEEPLAYGVTEAARLLGIHRASLYRRIREGEVRAVKLGHRTLVTRRDLEAYLNSLPAFEAEAS